MKKNNVAIKISIPLEYTKTNRTLTLVFDADDEVEEGYLPAEKSESDEILYQ